MLGFQNQLRNHANKNRILHRILLSSQIIAGSPSNNGNCGISGEGKGKVVVINMKDARISPKYDQIFHCQRPVLFKNMFLIGKL